MISQIICDEIILEIILEIMLEIILELCVCRTRMIASEIEQALAS